MKDFFLLTKTLIMCGLDIGTSEGKFKLDRSKSAIIGIVVIVALAAFIVKALMDVTAVTIAAGGDGLLLVKQGMAVGMLAALVMGIPMVLSAFYSSSDTTTLLSLPLPITTIASARFVRCLIYDYSLIVIFSLPPFIAFGLVTGAGALYWVFSILLFLLLPVTPLVYDAIVAMLLMRAFRGLHNKKLLTTIGTVVTFAFCMVWVFMGMQSGSGDSVGMEASLATFGSLGFLFPNLVFANAAIQQLSFVNLLLFLVASAALVAVFVLVARAIYFDSVIGMSEMSSRSEALSGKDVSQFGKAKKPLAAYLKIEQKKILHSSYLLQCFLSQFIWPMILIASLVFAAASRPEMDLNAMMSSISSSESGLVYLLAITIGMTFLCSSCNLVCSMEISLEGSGLAFLETFPLRFRDIVETKVRSGLYADYLISNFIPIVITLYCVFVNGMDPFAVAAVFAAGLSGTVAIKYIQIMFDLSSPNLNWTDQSSLGRKASTMFSAIAGIAVGCVMVVITLLPLFLLGLNALVVSMISVAACLAAGFGFRALALNYGEKRLRQLP